MSTTQTAKWPDELDPYITDILERAKNLSETGYEPYSGERIAGFTPEQQKIMDQILSYGGSQGAVGDIQDTFYTTDPLTGEKSLNPYDFTASDVGAKQWTDEGMQDAYMNPYTDQVVDKFRRSAEEDMLNYRQKNMANAVGKGAFGSSREAANTAIGDQKYLDRLAGKEADLFYKGYGQAANIFAKDADRSQAADRFNAGFGLEADKLNVLSEMNRAGALESLARTGQDLYLDEMALKGQVADADQQMDQANLDLAYEDFQRQQQFPYGQLDFYSGMVRGATPTTPFGTTTTQQQQPSFLQRLAGLGISALGLYGQGGGFSPGGFSFNNMFKW